MGASGKIQKEDQDQRDALGGEGAIFPSQSLFSFKIKLLSFLNCLLTFHLYIHLLLAVLGLHCSAGFSLVVPSGGYSLVAVRERLIAVVLLLLRGTASSSLQHCGSRALEHGPGGPGASLPCGTRGRSDPGVRPALLRPLRWQAESFPRATWEAPHHGNVGLGVSLVPAALQGSQQSTPPRTCGHSGDSRGGLC